MELIIDILKITIPGLIVAIAMYQLVKNQTERDYKLRLMELKQKNGEVVIPIRLQAYERIVLLLERITALCCCWSALPQATCYFA
jgi:hypothetical protein